MILFMLINKLYNDRLLTQWKHVNFGQTGIWNRHTRFLKRKNHDEELMGV